MTSFCSSSTSRIQVSLMSALLSAAPPKTCCPPPQPIRHRHPLPCGAPPCVPAPVQYPSPGNPPNGAGAETSRKSSPVHPAESQSRGLPPTLEYVTHAPQTRCAPMAFLPETQTSPRCPEDWKSTG